MTEPQALAVQVVIEGMFDLQIAMTARAAQWAALSHLVMTIVIQIVTMHHAQRSLSGLLRATPRKLLIIYGSVSCRGSKNLNPCSPSSSQQTNNFSKTLETAQNYTRGITL